MKRIGEILWYVLTLRCEEAERIRCCVGSEPTTWWERFAERLHRAACKSCRRARRELQALNAAIQGLVHAERGEADESPIESGLSGEARRRIRASLDGAEPRRGN